MILIRRSAAAEPALDNSGPSPSLRGFTLLEVLIAAAILTAGVISAASLFALAVQTNIRNEQRTEATVLAREKLEAFRLQPSRSDAWKPGGGLAADFPAAGFSEFVSADPSAAGVQTEMSFLRVWQVSASSPRVVTVVIYSRPFGMPRQRIELARMTASMQPGF